MKRARLALLSIFLLLAACTQFQPSAPKPNSTHSDAGLVQITFSGIGHKLHTSALNLGPQGLEGQSLGDLPGGIQFKLDANGYFDLAGERYLYATYRVRNADSQGNAYTTARHNLTFMAVITGSTLAGTAVTGLARFDGSDYSDKPTLRDQIAQEILPTQGLTLAGGTLSVRQHDADFEAFSESEAAALQAQVTGVSSVLPYGFVTDCVANCVPESRTLAANPTAGQFDGLVTFAVKLPLQANHADDPYKFSMLFEVVDDSTTRVTEGLAEQGTTNVQTRADALPGSLVTLLGNSPTGVSGHSVVRLCRVRTAGTDPNNPLVTLVNAGSPCNPSGTLPSDVRAVNASAPAGGDGTSWTTAFNSLQDALACVRSGGSCIGVTQLWVAGGVYYPDQGQGITAGDQTATFSLVPGLKLYGGFAGSELTLAERNWKQHVTVLSGDIDQNDNTDGNNVDESYANIQGANSYNVVTADGSATPIDSATLLDGFTITGGHALSSQATLGGGFLCNGAGSICSPMIKNTVFSGNTALSGGAFYADGLAGGNSSPTFIGDTFTGNQALTQGSAVYLDGGGGTSSPVFENVSFTSNFGSAVYGTIANGDVGSLNIVNALFWNNASPSARSGALLLSGPFELTLTNATVVGNSGSDTIYVISPSSSPPHFNNVIIWGNGNGTTLQLYAPEGIIQDSILEGGCPTDYGITCTNVLGQDPLFVNQADGDFHLTGGSPAIDTGNNSVLPQDTYDLDGDGSTSEILPVDLDGNPRIVDWGSDGTANVDMGTYEKQP